MAKIKVHELAKELELQSKDILNFLQEKGIEAKAAQSSLEEDAAALVRNSLGQKKATAAPAVEKKLRQRLKIQSLLRKRRRRKQNLPRKRKRRKRLFS